MPLDNGARIGPYQIVGLLGVGGMGEVYRASDTRLDRSVALKTLRHDLSTDTDFRLRFVREGKVISSLNHPNICTLYDVGQQEDLSFLVMEHIIGDTLAERLKRGPLPLQQAIDCAIEIASALDHAHRRGVVHRDLKPANVVLTKSGTKLLDFGIAKLVQASSDSIALPAVAETITAQGMVVGTVHYMAPEQLHGKETDGRADLFALGCLMYEALIGSRAFEGESHATVVSKIVGGEPERLEDLAAIGPPELERIVRRCLAKDPEERWQTARDLVSELKWISQKLQAPKTAALPAASEDIARIAVARKRGNRLVWGAAAVAVTLAALIIPSITGKGWSLPSFGSKPQNGPTVAFAVVPQDESLSMDQDAGGSAISPNGQTLAVVARKDGKAVLALRPMASLAFRVVEGSEGAAFPFWSPDSSWIGFFSRGKLRRVPASGGLPQPLCDAPEPNGGSWSQKGVILFALKSAGPVFSVPENGGTPQAATKLSAAEGQYDHAWPHFLPDGDTFLFLSRTSKRQAHQIYATSLSNPSVTVKLVASNYRASYGVHHGAASSSPGNGSLLYLRDGTLMAHPFDTKRISLEGQPKAVAYDVASTIETGYANFSTSSNGLLVHRSGRESLRQLRWVKRNGDLIEDTGKMSQFLTMRLSPDQSTVVSSRIDNETGLVDLWLLDLSRKISTRLTSDDGLDVDPVWSPRGDEIVFGSSPQTILNLFRKSLSSSPPMQLAKSGNAQRPSDWSSDGASILYEEEDPRTGRDIWMIPAAGGTPKVVVQTAFNEYQGQWSPDMNWIAYTSDDSGRPEVFVQPANRQGARLRISVDGGSQPRWKGDGKEIYYVGAESNVTAAPFSVDKLGQAQVGQPVALFDLPAPYPGATDYRYDVSRDGSRFLLLTTASKAKHVLHVTVNWRPQD